MTNKQQTQMGKLNQILFLTDRSDTIESCFINSNYETVKLYFNNNIVKEFPFIEFDFEQIDKAIEWLETSIKTEIDTSYELANMKHRDYIRYYL